MGNPPSGIGGRDRVNEKRPLFVLTTRAERQRGKTGKREGVTGKRGWFTGDAMDRRTDAKVEMIRGTAC